MRIITRSLDDVQQQYQWLQQMRETQPVWRDESSKFWHVFRYNDVHHISMTHQLFSSENGQLRASDSSNSDSSPRPRGGRSLLAMDPPEHRSYRDLVAPSFTPRALARLSNRIATITQELLDQIRPTGKIDIVTDFAYPLPTIVIAELLGVPADDRPQFKLWADELLSRQVSDEEFVRQRSEGSESANKVINEMTDYFEGMLEPRRSHPRDDMMSELLAAEVGGEHLSVEDTIAFCNILLIAGHVTTTNLLGQAIRCFDEHPEVVEQLRKAPELMPGAIEEVLRYASPVWRLARTAKQDVTIDGVTIPEGSLIFAWLASANRDAEQFPDPEKFDITRSPNKHLAFGHGVHFCVGAPLSRMEAAIALPMILEQLPQLHLSHDEPLETYGGGFLFGFKHMPATFTPSN